MLTQWKAVSPLDMALALESSSYSLDAEYERIRQSGRERLLELSRPKEPKVEWWTNVGPNVMWGTQEMLWPIPATTKDASDRVQTLATPKKNFQTGNNCSRPLFYYSCGRPSMVWEVKGIDDNASERVVYLSKPKAVHRDYKEDNHGSLGGKESNMDVLSGKGNLNPRGENLKVQSSGHPQIGQADSYHSGGEYPVHITSMRQFLYSCGRNSPVWQVKGGAKSADGANQRIEQLSRHKTPHREFLPARQVETVIPNPALSASVTERLSSLATPKQRPEGPFRAPQWPVTPAAKNASAKSRSLELARPKGTVDGYQLPREEMWPVSRAAKRATASGRLGELSKPVVRASMDHVQFNPDAFLVKEMALKGTTPNIRRIEELAQPIQR